MEHKVIDCAEARELMPLFLSGELDAPDRYQSHLAICPCCHQLVRAAREQDEVLRQAVLAEPVAAGPIIDRFHRLQGAPVWRRWAVAAALVLVAAAGIRMYRRQTSPDLPTAAIADHTREIVKGEPRRWIADAAGIATLAGKQGVSTEVLARLAPAGYRLEQGRVCFLNGRVYLHLVYEKGGELISLFVRHDAGAAGLRDSLVHTADRDGQHAVGREANALSVAYVTNEADEAGRLAEQVSQVL